MTPSHNLRLPASGRRGDWTVTRDSRTWNGEESLFTFLRQRIDGRQVTWMSDTPMEMAWTRRLADQVEGDHILIGGLGLGLLPQMLLPRAGRTVLILENSPKVIDLVLRDWEMPTGLMVQQADVWEFLRYAPSVSRYDTVIMDIWRTIDEEARREIGRLRQLAEPWLRPGGRFVAWGD